MTIPTADMKLLWGRAAGFCSNPDCRRELTALVETGEAYSVGEMAHVIARRAGGPRGQEGGGPDSYANLILLCPTCHRHIDKAPAEEYAEARLRAWKTEHEGWVQRRLNAASVDTRAELEGFVRRWLLENQSTWKLLGPQSQVATTDPGSNLHEMWTLRKLDLIIPNNTRIINLIEAHLTLLSAAEQAVFFKFKAHALAFEQHQLDRSDAYPCFPTEFGHLFLS